jgi:hypothetical protein
MRNKLFKSAIPGRAPEQSFSPVGRIWPNGEFSLGYVPQLEDADSTLWSCLQSPQKRLSPEDDDEYFRQLELWEDEVDANDSLHGQPCSEPLTLSDAYNSHSPPPRAAYGLNGLTGRGRKMIRSGAYLLEQKLGTDDVVMITLTVPTLSREQRQRVAKRWGVLTNRLVQYLTRELLKAGRSPAIVGCVEVQTARLSKYSEAYLHLHLVCPAHSNAGRTWAVSATDLRSWWHGALERVIEATLPNLPRVETALVEKSVEAYLAKYLSKGSDEGMAEFIADLGEECVPGQWWFCSSAMRSAIRENTLEGGNCGALLDSVIQHLLREGTGEGFDYIRHVDRMIGGVPVTCGWTGRLSPALRSELDTMLRRP